MLSRALDRRPVGGEAGEGGRTLARRGDELRDGSWLVRLRGVGACVRGVPCCRDRADGAAPRARFGWSTADGGAATRLADASGRRSATTSVAAGAVGGRDWIRCGTEARAAGLPARRAFNAPAAVTDADRDGEAGSGDDVDGGGGGASAERCWDGSRTEARVAVLPIRRAFDALAAGASGDGGGSGGVGAVGTGWGPEAGAGAGAATGAGSTTAGAGGAGAMQTGEKVMSGILLLSK